MPPTRILAGPSAEGAASLDLRRLVLLLAVMGSLAACSEPGPTSTAGSGDEGARFPTCDLPKEFLFVPAARDLIPSLDDPAWTWLRESPDPDYLRDEDRVIGVFAFGLAWALPHSVLWHHEIANFVPGGPNGPALAVTYCPLTGSAAVFERSSVDRATFGVSGFVFMNNLMLYDRQDPADTLWPQMMAEARCGSRTGSTLTYWPFLEVQWARWKEMYPETYVLSGAEAQGFDPSIFEYAFIGYPYGTYRQDDRFFYAGLMPYIDRRRFPKERVIGLPSTSGDVGIAFPFGALEDSPEDAQIVEFLYEGRSVVLLWSDAGRGGSVYSPLTEGGDPVTLRVVEGSFVDEESGSRWTVNGRAVSGPREGQRLVHLPGAQTAFWGSWAVFHPDTRLWEG